MNVTESAPVSKTETIGGRAWLSLLAGIAMLAVAIMMIPGKKENPRTAENQAPLYNAVHAGTNPASVKRRRRTVVQGRLHRNVASHSSRAADRG